MLNFEADEAGKLRAFRERFGRGWDAGASGGGEGDEMGEGDRGEEGGREDNLMDLISGFGREAEAEAEAEAGVREGKERSGKRKGGER